MKSIFTRPLFINPQAYLTIPELSYIQMATPFDFTEDSYSFVINTSGRIEGKLLKTSNDYILHLDLYSIDGNCVLGEFYLNNSELNTDNFNLTQSKNIITLQFGEQSSGNITYPGLIAAWSAKGKSNDDEDRATLKDLTGNGHDITLNGFAFSEMSGYGGYNCIFVSNAGINRYEGTFTSNHAHITKFIEQSNRNLINIRINSNFIIDISGLTGDRLVRIGPANIATLSLNNGTHKIDGSLFMEEGKIYSIGILGTLGEEETNINIDILPEYPDALVFDGVDDFGINENVPILTDFTVIAKRKTFKDETSEQKSPFISKMFMMGTGAFAIEGAWAYNNVINFGADNNINYIDNDITFVTKNNYNEQSIISGSFIDNQGICIGTIRPSHTVRWKGAIYSVYLFDRSLDEQEIKAFIRKYIDPEYLLPSEIPTPDCYYDFSQGSNDDENRETIKDYSGNGNDAVAHNFAWSDMSGYGGYVTNFKTKWSTVEDRGVAERQYNKVVITESNTNTMALLYNSSGVNIMKVKVTGLQQNQSIKFGHDASNTIVKEITQDGIYNMDFTNMEIAKPRCIIPGFIGECNITIELLPEYPGALVFDGVYDYVSLDAFYSGFKTMFMVCKPFKVNQILYDQRSTAAKNDFALYTESAKSIAYNGRNKNGTYINNKLSNYKIQYTLNKKQLITVKSELTEIHKPNIGCNQTNSNFFANMTLYKFLGFKEALTEEQIQAVIKKYNLLDGVDEIEVS